MSRRSLAIAVAIVLSVAAIGCADDEGTDTSGDAGTASIDECDWAMWGHDLTASYTQPCETAISTETVDDLGQAWFFATDDVVTASPAVVDGTVYVGDWSGRFYAIDAESGEPRWTFDADVHPTVYAGQIVSSAAVADVDGERTVYFGGGKTLYALRADDGSERWRHEIGRLGDGDDPTEIESSPIVVDGKVIFGYDVHNSRQGEPAGVHALDAATGDVVWTLQTAPSEGEGATGSGCGDVWGSASVDEERDLAFFGTGNCVTEEWGRFSEALIAVDLDSGDLAWTYQPHEQNHDDLDFAGMPNLFEVNGRAVVGLGNKDGSYYTVDRETGEELWRAKGTDPGLEEPGSDFSTGGFIGSTATSDGIIVGGTAVGPGAFLHAFDAASGAIAWQQQTPAATYASATVANGVVFLGGTDFTMRAFDLADGEILWEHEMPAVIAGGGAVVGDDLFSVTGLREPGLEPDEGSAGVAKFSLGVEPSDTTTTTAGEPDEPMETAAPGSQPCLGEPCEMGFLVDVPAGLNPRIELTVDLDPWKVTLNASGLGEPNAWVRPGSPDAAVGASVFGLFMSESDSNPTGGLLCVLDDNFRCESSEIPNPGATYNRITVLALENADQFPEIQSGINRLVATISFDPPLAPQ